MADRGGSAGIALFNPGAVMILETVRRATIMLVLSALALGANAGAPDRPFPQAISHQFALPDELRGTARQLAVDQDGIVYLLTDKGVARLFDDRVALDRSYRPLAGKIATDLITVQGRLYYLFPEEVVSNRRAGKLVHKLSTAFETFAVNEAEEVLLASRTGLSLLKDGQLNPVPWEHGAIKHVAAAGKRFFALTDHALSAGSSGSFQEAAEGHFTCFAPGAGGEVLLGSTNGYRILNSSGNVGPLQDRLPAGEITALAVSPNAAIWAGTTRGVWRRDADGSFRYFASKRWLDDDHVLDIALDEAGNVYALTRTGLNKIEFRSMTLAEKAMRYERKIRQRHIRYGFCAELRLRVPGDITTAEMIDTDNDGTWSNYYMASQAFRYGATGDEQARRNAWETFEALERLETINPLEGFPSRTFERTGFKVSDPERWHARGDGIWDWKAHTSSDEVTAHCFGSAALYECVAKTAEERERIARFISRVLDHIIRNDWYLIDVDGEPTLWARWNPEYVNWFPRTIVDRKLNSAEIIALLQFGYAITGNELYKEKAFELLEKHDYLGNIMSPMAKISLTRGYIHEGIELGTDWNHSDDLLAFVSYWVLNRYAFNEELRAKYRDAIREHWEIEKVERCPLWNFVYASTGAREFDLEGALWTLRYFPLDMRDWRIVNSLRGDITRKESNFREQQLEELLPPDERRITRWNSQPFILDGGSGGHGELAGDEFLLPYWMGRYLKLIE